MKAMILSAGLGTRLRPITDHIPKALVEINGTTLLEHNLLKLKSFGFDEVIINLHHYPEQIKNFLTGKNNFGLKIFFSEEEEILNTGGGIKQASWFLKGQAPVLIHNVDILSDIDFRDMLAYHSHQNAMVTLAVSERKSSRQFLFNMQHELKGWQNKNTGEIKLISQNNEELKQLAFSGIHILSPEFFDLITEDGSFPIIDTYLRLAEKFKIVAFVHNSQNWFDVGKIEDLENIRKKFVSK